MKATKEDQLDSVVSKVIQKIPLKSPSDDFTQNLMHKINVQRTTQTTIVYQPLISKQVWVFLGVAFLFLIGYVGVQNIGITSVPNFIEKIYADAYINSINTLEILSTDFSIDATSPYVYGASILLGFLLIEIAILKRKYFS